MMHAELEGVVCSGAWRGKQFTYALLDERAPHDCDIDARGSLGRTDQALHSRVTARPPCKDFVWWSGYDERRESRSRDWPNSQVMHEVADGRTYWFTASAPIPDDPSPAAFLLPNYDELIVGVHRS